MNLKLKRTPGLYLVGFMGSGKSTIGRLLAERLGWHFADLDEEIEAAQKIPISEIFEKRGEAEFRRLESEMLLARVKSIEGGRPTVVALGGGTFAQPENRDLLISNGLTVWLDCPFDIVQRRVGEANHRPLARDPEKFAQLYETRRTAYGYAEARVSIEGDDPERAVEAILNLKLFQ